MGRFPHFRKAFPHGVQGRFAGVELCHPYQNAVDAHFRIAYHDLCCCVGQVQGVLDNNGFSINFFQRFGNGGVVILRDDRFLADGGNVCTGCRFLGFPVGLFVRQAFEQFIGISRSHFHDVFASSSSIPYDTIIRQEREDVIEPAV